MAYGVIMGQTPILNASGVTYDNSQTSSIITANNVQQAIDESAKKIENVQSSGAQWELIYNKSFSENYTDVKFQTHILDNTPLKNLDSRKYLYLYFILSGTTKASILNTELSIGFGQTLYKNKNNSNNTVNIYFPILNLGRIYDSRYSTELLNRYEVFYGDASIYIDNITDTNLDFFIENTGVSASLQLTLQIYGLKAPI